MSTYRRQRAAWWRRWVAAALARSTPALRQRWRRTRRWHQPVPVAVLIADPAGRRALERELRRGLARLQHVLGVPLPAGLAVVVQQVISTDRQLAGCYQLGQHLDGRPFALVRLALQVNGRRLVTDEVLAVLAEQCIGVLTRQSPSVLIPVELEPDPAERQPPTPLRTDPLAPHPIGRATSDESA